jgi:hypothetical protein
MQSFTLYGDRQRFALSYQMALSHHVFELGWPPFFCPRGMGFLFKKILHDAFPLKIVT